MSMICNRMIIVYLIGVLEFSDVINFVTFLKFNFNGTICRLISAIVKNWCIQNCILQFNS